MDRKKEFGSFRDPTGHVVYISLIPVIDIAKHGRSAHRDYSTSCRVKRVQGVITVAWSNSKPLRDRINASVPLSSRRNAEHNVLSELTLKCLHE